MITIKDYAEAKNVSYEAVRKQLKRYQEELKGHIFKENRTQLLDEMAVTFLDEKRQASPIIIMENSKDDEIQRLQEENKKLLLKIADLQEKLLDEKDQVKQLQAEQIQLLTATTKEKQHKSLLEKIFNRT